MNFRKIIFWCHLPLGVAAGCIIFIMSATGALLTYQRQITDWVDRSYRSEPPSRDATRLSVEILLGRFRETRPDSVPSAFTLRSDPRSPATVGIAGGRTFFMNPYSGEVLGEGSPKVRAFFRTLTDWHRWLGTQGERRPIGRAITGACNLAFLFIIVSGFYLWWPRQSVKAVTWFRRGVRGKARDWNWHNVIGFWSALPLFLVVLCSVVMSYPWANNLLYRLTGSKPPSVTTGPGRAGATADSPRAVERRSSALELNGLNALWIRAERQAVGWQSISLRFPTSPSASLTFLIDEGNGGRPDKRSQLTLDRKSAELLRWEPFSSYEAGRQARSWIRWVHTGEAGGVAGQTIAGLASAGGAFLVWTGVALAWRRYSTRRIRTHSLEPIRAESYQSAL